jgi:hypothetical protein
MPAPRVPTEAAYAAVMFAVDKNRLPSEWLRYYFTLELALDTSAHWVLGAWDDSNHLNFGDFEYEPTVENFLKIIVSKCGSDTMISFHFNWQKTKISTVSPTKVRNVTEAQTIFHDPKCIAVHLRLCR